MRRLKMRMLRRNALSFLTCMPIAAAAGGASVATAAVPEEKPKTSGKILFVVTSINFYNYVI